MATKKKKRTSDRRTTDRSRPKPGRRAAQRHGDFPIVGIGASAGGLPALEEFVRHVPEDSGIAFVVATHQHPEHTSLLPDLLAKCTRLEVLPARNGLPLTPNKVYVGPPGQEVEIRDSTFVLRPGEGAATPRGRLPIDHLFRSLAAVKQDKAIGIVLSGTGTDGTLGLKAIKAANGMTMAQLPESAKYDGMPKSAIASNIIDYVLAPGQMGAVLVDYVNGPYFTTGRPRQPARQVPAVTDAQMQEIFALLENRTRHDFSDYKTNTLRRRIERRMNVHRMRKPQDYVQFLKNEAHEVDILFKELLINVTSFFRDPQAFEVLRCDVLPVYLRAVPRDYTMRIWVPGCSTGEEAYSLLMTFQECVEELNRPVKVQVFASDLDLDAINAGRAGFYPEGISADVSPERLERFFVKQDTGYQISRELRELVVFAHHNVAKDPPFTKLDFISCRNLLIYLNATLQRKLVPLFHYALKPKGILFLGSSESLAGFKQGFEEVSGKWKIFRRDESAEMHAAFADFPRKSERAHGARRDSHSPDASRLADFVEDLLLDEYVPPSVLVNERGDILYIHGRTGAYLEPASGHPRLNVLEMAREGLRLELPGALRHAAAQDREIRRSNIRVRANGDDVLVNLVVRKLEQPQALRGLFLIAFSQPRSETSIETAEPLKKSTPRKTRVAELETELQQTQANLRTTIEELETSNEELTSTNEELQSTNEELQSTNEEVETSKEEMQSLNEELTTVNAELHSKVEELYRVNDDMTNLLNSTDIATIFLDTELRIKRFTPQAVHMIKLIDTDVGRPVGDLASNLKYEGLAEDGREVLKNLKPKEAGIQTVDGRRYLMRILPYRTAENIVDGLVYTFVDIERIMSAESGEAIERGIRQLVEYLVQMVQEPMAILDNELRIEAANHAFRARFTQRQSNIEGKYLRDLGKGEWNVPRLEHLLQRALREKKAFENFRIDQELSDGGRRTLVLSGRHMELLTKEALILIAVEDVSDGKRSA